MNTVTRIALAPIAAAAAIVPSAAFAQTDAVETALATADITNYLSSAQGLIVAGLVMVVAFVFLRKAFR